MITLLEYYYYIYHGGNVDWVINADSSEFPLGPNKNWNKMEVPYRE
jgi:hypothetical protein